MRKISILYKCNKYDFHNSTDILKFWTEKHAINDFFVFHLILIKLGEVVLKFHQLSSKSDEKQKSFINGMFFCSEFQSVSRIVKFAHRAISKSISWWKFWIIRNFLGTFWERTRSTVCPTTNATQSNSLRTMAPCCYDSFNK